MQDTQNSNVLGNYSLDLACGTILGLQSRNSVSIFDSGSQVAGFVLGYAHPDPSGSQHSSTESLLGWLKSLIIAGGP